MKRSELRQMINEELKDIDVRTRTGIQDKLSDAIEYIGYIYKDSEWKKDKNILSKSKKVEKDLEALWNLLEDTMMPL